MLIDVPESHCICCSNKRKNLSVRKDGKNIVDRVTMEEIGDKKAFCRCWKSAKFPYCDGAHNKHNEEPEENVGPLIVKKLE